MSLVIAFGKCVCINRVWVTESMIEVSFDELRAVTVDLVCLFRVADAIAVWCQSYYRAVLLMQCNMSLFEATSSDSVEFPKTGEACKERAGDTLQWID